jgi:hypothetical protein
MFLVDSYGCVSGSESLWVGRPDGVAGSGRGFLAGRGGRGGVKNLPG